MTKDSFQYIALSLAIDGRQHIVHDDQITLGKERSGNTQTLFLPARKRNAFFTNDRFLLVMERANIITELTYV